MAKHLKTAAIGEHRTVPGDEMVQPPQIVDELVSRPKIEVVGVSKDDLGAQHLKFLLGNCFDRAGSSHRNKHRSRDISVSRRDLAQTRLSVGIGGSEFEMQTVSCKFKV